MLVTRCDKFEPNAETEFKKDRYPMIIIALSVMLAIALLGWALMYFKK